MALGYTASCRPSYRSLCWFEDLCTSKTFPCFLFLLSAFSQDWKQKCWMWSFPILKTDIELNNSYYVSSWNRHQIKPIQGHHRHDLLLKPQHINKQTNKQKTDNLWESTKSLYRVRSLFSCAFAVPPSCLKVVVTATLALPTHSVHCNWRGLVK